jgi:polyferredoxin
MASFCRICPAAALQVTVPGLIGNSIKTLSWPVIMRMSVLVGVILLAVYSRRSFCKAFCPIGALLAPLNYLSFWKISVPVENCLACGKCNRACPMNGAPAERMATHTPPNRLGDCIVCHECQQACPRPKKKEPKAQ